MSSNLDSSSLSIETLNAQLGKSIVQYGYEEKLSTGALDTTNVWTQTLVNSGAVTYTVLGYINCSTGATNASRVMLNMKRLLASRNIGTTSSPFAKVCCEFYMVNANACANLDETKFAIGFSIYNAASHEHGNDVLAFGITAAGKLACYTNFQAADVEEYNTTLDFNGGFNEYLCRLEFDGLTIKYYVNSVLKHTYTFVTPNSAYVTNAFINVVNKTAADAQVNVQNFRVWYVLRS